MADDVKVPINRENAILLLAAARELGLDSGVVRTAPTEGQFTVPAEVADKAGLGEDTNEQPKKAPAKKAAAKKTATKKAAAKKAAAKGQE